jgi:hypothetical protein
MFFSPRSPHRSPTLCPNTVRAGIGIAVLLAAAFCPGIAGPRTIAWSR